jgi:hypothetical protein
LFSMRLQAVPSRLVPGASGPSLCFHVECGLVDVHTATQIWTLSLAFNNVAKLPPNCVFMGSKYMVPRMLKGLPVLVITR